MPNSRQIQLLMLCLLVAFSLSGCRALFKAASEGGQAAAKTTKNAAKVGEAGAEVANKGSKVAGDAADTANKASKGDGVAGEVAEHTADAVDAMMNAKEFFSEDSEGEWNDQRLAEFKAESERVAKDLGKRVQKLPPEQRDGLSADLEAFRKSVGGLEPGADAASVDKVKNEGMALLENVAKLKQAQ